jgi:hypothetical protein
MNEDFRRNHYEVHFTDYGLLSGNKRKYWLDKSGKGITTHLKWLWVDNDNEAGPDLG